GPELRKGFLRIISAQSACSQAGSRWFYFCLLTVCFSAGELPQGVFGKDATAEFDPFVHQLKQHVLGFEADRR
ncbi:MAG TPA: hypothetical protein VFW91_02090, partial [Candidatus Binatia bacterium]|nr:hypothetical protein [Candidatus Binatia bacterium]